MILRVYFYVVAYLPDTKTGKCNDESETKSPGNRYLWMNLKEFRDVKFYLDKVIVVNRVKVVSVSKIQIFFSQFPILFSQILSHAFH